MKSRNLLPLLIALAFLANSTCLLILNFRKSTYRVPVLREFRGGGHYEQFLKRKQQEISDKNSFAWRWYTRSINRDMVEAVDRTLEILHLKPGDVVADIGCGGGYYAIRFAPLVRLVGMNRYFQKEKTPRGIVYALDIDPTSIAFLNEQIKLLQIEEPELPTNNIIVFKSSVTDTKLPEGVVDVAFLSNAHFSVYLNWDEEGLLCAKSIYRALKRGGRLFVIEANTQGPGFIGKVKPTKALLREYPVIKVDSKGVKTYRITKELLVKRFTMAGFSLKASYDYLQSDHVLLFEKE